MNTMYRFNNCYRLNNGKVQFRISGYYPEKQEVLLKFGALPVKMPVSNLQGILLEGYLLAQLGFTQDRFHDKFWKKDDHIVYLAGKGQFRLAYKYQPYTKFYRYLHQLQNIFFENTGSELM